MNYDNVIQLTAEALMLCLVLSLPAVAVAAIVGLLVALAQAVTSVQDQSISQGIKLICVTVTVAVAAPWIGGTVLQFSQRLLSAIFSP